MPSLSRIGRPGRLIGETAVGMFGQSVDHIGRERAFAHMGKSRGNGEN
jgi:hypothetical protein